MDNAALQVTTPHAASQPIAHQLSTQWDARSEKSKNFRILCQKF